MPRRRGETSHTANIWPGFVDALATLLIAIIFVLVIFVIAQIMLSQTISGKDEALEKLNKQMSELAEILDLERQANADLRLNITQLSSSLQGAMGERDSLLAQLDEMKQRTLTQDRVLTEVEDKLADRDEELRKHLLMISSLQQDIASLRELREELESEVGKLSAGLKTAESQAKDLLAENQSLSVDLGAERDRSKRLEARLADEKERTLLAQTDLQKRDVHLAELTERYETLSKEFDETVNLNAQQAAQIALLNRQLNTIKKEVQALNNALEAYDEKDRQQRAVIKDLGRRLNKALASKVAELARYRSEFFGRLREVLGERRDIRIVGDRFVFQSEVLFGSGSAELGGPGRAQLDRLGSALLEISKEIPQDINWVLRVDGHTDDRPIKTAQFPSNWELSAARAISVVRHLMKMGVSPERLVAAGFGEYQPLDAKKDEIARRRNRRIEFKFTQR